MKLENRLKDEHEVWIHAIYHVAWPSCVAIERNNDRDTQLLGVDQWIVLRDGHKIRLEEKVRPTYDFPDILLEDVSVVERGVVGWALDDTKISQYLAYIVVKAKSVRIFNYPALRSLFQERHDIWTSTFGLVTSSTRRNDGSSYHTSNVAVPLSAFPLHWLATYSWAYEWLPTGRIRRL